VELLDELVLAQLEGRVFTPAKLREILTVARRALRERTAADRQKLAHLQAELRKADERLGRLYEAVEVGLLPLDETLQKRVQQAKAARESVLVEMAGLRRLQLLPVEQVLPSQVEAFSKVIRAKLRDQSSRFAKDYLHAVVDSVVVHDDTAIISGSHARLMQAVVGKKTGTDQVPSFIPDWRARRDSNSRPSGS
jgi:site-specific DNA recombinase